MTMSTSSPRARNALVTGSARGDIPIIAALKLDGWRVVSGGLDSYAPGIAYADEHVPFDYSSPSQVVEAAKSMGVTAIIPSSHDLAVVPAAVAAKELGLSGHDSPENAGLLHNKAELRNHLFRLGIPAPRVFDRAELSKVLEQGLSIIVKPADLAGGRGISRAASLDQAEFAIRSAMNISRAGQVVVEEFLDGTHHGITFAVSEGRCNLLFCDNEYYGENQFRVQGAHSVSDLTPEETTEVGGWMQKLVDSLSLVDGILHLQVIRTSHGTKIIEIMRRAPGDGYPLLVELSTGLNLGATIVSGFTGNAINLKGHSFYAPAKVIRHVVTARAPGLFGGIRIPASIRKFLVGSLIWARPREPITDTTTWSAGALYWSSESDSFLSLLGMLRDRVYAETLDLR